MAVVSCPECNKKLKVADTSIGKKVKCSCGNIFVAELEEAPAPPPPPKKAAVAVSPEKVFVACTECGAKLKVATTSLGKKMKCPKCSSVFVANTEEEEAPPPPPPPPPPKKTVKAAPKSPVEEDEEEEPVLKPKAAKTKAKPSKGEDEMDALFGFAQEDAANKIEQEEDEPLFTDDEDLPKPKAKALKGKGKPSRPREDEDEDEIPDDEDDFPRTKPKAKPKEEPKLKPVYPKRTLVNIGVLVLLLSYIGIFGLVYFDLEFQGKAGMVRPTLVT